MMNKRKIFLLLMVLVEWFALIAQLVLHLQNADTGVVESIIRFFSYFTILTNILVAVYVTAQLLLPVRRLKGFFFSASVQTAIALYIITVGLIYNIILRQLWHAAGLQAVLHDLLHTVIPILSLVYWWRWVYARRLQYRNIPAWLIYPAVYAIVVIARAHFSLWYPYPFLDAGTLGYPKVILNSALLVVVFFLFSFVFVFVGKRKTVYRRR